MLRLISMYTYKYTYRRGIDVNIQRLVTNWLTHSVWICVQNYDQKHREIWFCFYSRETNVEYHSNKRHLCIDFSLYLLLFIFRLYSSARPPLAVMRNSALDVHRSKPLSKSNYLIFILFICCFLYNVTYIWNVSVLCTIPSVNSWHTFYGATCATNLFVGHLLDRLKLTTVRNFAGRLKFFSKSNVSWQCSMFWQIAKWFD